jgi:RNA polymerase primary sigma factor
MPRQRKVSLTEILKASREEAQGHTTRRKRSLAKASNSNLQGCSHPPIKRRGRRPKRALMSYYDEGFTAEHNGDELSHDDGFDNEPLQEPVLRRRDVAIEDPMAAWAKELRKRPLLTKEQEIELAKRIEAMRQAQQELEQLAAEGSLTPQKRMELSKVIRDGEEARMILVESNLRLVVSIARRYRGYGVSLSDLIQEGNIGLIQAVDKFDWRRDCRFSTCATLWIRQAVVRAIQAQSQLVKLPTRISELVHRMSRVKDMLAQELGREPTVDELSRSIRMQKHLVEQYMSYPYQIMSLDEPVDDDEKMTLADAIEDKHSLGPEEVTMKMRSREEIEQALSKLPENYRLVIKLRYGLEDGKPYTYQEIGRILNLSRQRVKQIADAALKRLKEDPLVCDLVTDMMQTAGPIRGANRRF